MRARLLALTAASAARLALPLALAMVITAAGALGCAATTAAGPRLASADASAAGFKFNGNPAAGIGSVALVDLDQTPRSLDAIRAGRVALITFWATWCEACEREMAALNRLNDRATGEHAVVIGIAVGEPAPRVKGFVRQHALGYAQLVDEDFVLTDALDQRRLPATVVVGRAGEIVYRGGELDAAALAAFRKAMAAGADELH